ncbi:LAT2-like protein, partial [Mya arenaria]
MDETMPGPDTSNLLTAGQAEPAEVSKAIKREQSPSIEIVHPKLTVFQTCAIVVSSVGGSGLFVAMSTIMRTSGSVGAMLIVVLISGLLNYSLANCFAEVAVQLPKAGGPYFFIKQVFGDFPAFLFLWGFFFLIVTPIWGFLAYTSAIYIVQLFFPGSLTILANCMYLPFVTKLQMILTSAKIVAMQLITFLLEEMDSPEKNLPKTLSISFTIAITLSELVVAAYFVVLSPQEVLSGDAVAVSLISLVMLLLLEASTIIKMTSFMATVMGLAVLLCLLALRVRKPDAHRPLQEPRDIGLLALFMLAGTPVYIVCVRWSKPKEVEKLI